MSRCSLAARLIMPFMGFKRTTIIGPLWLKFMTPDGGSLRPDFERLLDFEFDNVISAHGGPRLGGAHTAVAQAVARAFPD